STALGGTQRRVGVYHEKKGTAACAPPTLGVAEPRRSLMKPCTRRLALLAVLAARSLPILLPRSGAQTPFKTLNYNRKVVPLPGLLQKQGVKLDQDAAASWFALVTADGKIYPLVKDDGARMFFKDPRVLNRPMRLTGRLVPGSELLQVVKIHSYKDG